MGKVVKALAVIVVAVAIAYFAPQLSAMFLASLGAAGTTIAAIALTAVATVAMKAIGLMPRVGPPSATTGAPVTTARLLNRVRGSHSPTMLAEMPPKQLGWFRRFDLWGHWSRFGTVRLDGNFLDPVCPAAFAIVDMEAPIRRGDVFIFDILDFDTAMPQLDRRAVDSLGKVFAGLDAERGVVEFETLTPPAVYETGLDNITFAYRARTTAPTLKEARRLRRRVARDPGAFDSRLGAAGGQ